MVATNHRALKTIPLFSKYNRYDPYDAVVSMLVNVHRHVLKDYDNHVYYIQQHYVTTNIELKHTFSVVWNWEKYIM